MRSIATFAGALLLAGTASAEELTSQAKTWGLSEEVATAFTATVVDVQCALSDDCPENCGNGSRPMGLVDTQGRVVLVAKNAQAQFNGAVVDLLPYCGNVVDVDGLMTGHGGVSLFQIQFIREQDAGDWQPAKNWTAAWNAANPDAQGKGPWFRRDPRILERIERDGYLGLGLEEDARFIADW